MATPYLVNSPWWLKMLYPSRIWNVKGARKCLYLSFDDGPHPQATPFVLDQLQKYNAKASFFCIGNNVTVYPKIYERILNEGHAVGNHTYNHVNGWKISDEEYVADYKKAAMLINSNLFRPPYGRLKSSQAKEIKKLNHNLQIIMWSVLSGDFDKNNSSEKCLKNVITNAGNGSIVVFHDSKKCFSMLEYALPKVLDYFSKKGYRFEALLMD